MLLSSTMYADASICFRKFQYRWIERLVTKPALLSKAMRRGIWLHRCLEDYHQNKNWCTSLRAMRDWAEDHGVDPAKADEIMEETREIMLGYVDYWANDYSWTVLGAEIPIVLEVPGGGAIRATIDLAIQWRGEDYLVEHKSTAEFPPSSWRSVDPQTALQYWLCHAVKPEIDGRVFKPVGIIFNYLKTDLPQPPRWKKNGELYANCALTTTRMFNKGLTAAVMPSGLPIDEAADRAKIVNDNLFFARYPVHRPEGAVLETMQDIVATLRDLKTAQDNNWYRRSLHVVTCRRFCSYQALCSHEFLLGQKSPTLREELFNIDDGSRGGGRGEGR